MNCGRKWRNKIVERDEKGVAPNADHGAFHVHAAAFQRQAGPIAAVAHVQNRHRKKRDHSGQQKHECRGHQFATQQGQQRENQNRPRQQQGKIAGLGSDEQRGGQNRMPQIR
jgi:hypothetical protein